MTLPVLLLLYLPRYVGRQWGMEMQTATISASLAAAGAAAEDDCGDRAFADGQWKCRRASWFLLRDQLLVLCLWDGGFLQWGMENVVLKFLPRCGGRW